MEEKIYLICKDGKLNCRGFQVKSPSLENLWMLNHRKKNSAGSWEEISILPVGRGKPTSSFYGGRVEKGPGMRGSPRETYLVRGEVL